MSKNINSNEITNKPTIKIDESVSKIIQSSVSLTKSPDSADDLSPESPSSPSIKHGGWGMPSKKAISNINDAKIGLSSSDSGSDLSPESPSSPSIKHGGWGKPNIKGKNSEGFSR